MLITPKNILDLNKGSPRGMEFAVEHDFVCVISRPWTEYDRSLSELAIYFAIPFHKAYSNLTQPVDPFGPGPNETGQFYRQQFYRLNKLHVFIFVFFTYLSLPLKAQGRLTCAIKTNG